VLEARKAAREKKDESGKQELNSQI